MRAAFFGHVAVADNVIVIVIVNVIVNVKVSRLVTSQL